VDIGKVDGKLSANACTDVIRDLDNWLFCFDTVFNGDKIQQLYVII
jgi:hypothetical protein